MTDWKLFEDILSVDSTTGREGALSQLLWERLEAPRKERFPVGDGTENLLLSWGTPRLVFCTHMDTVPPYIPPRFTEDAVYGRGACDAKGQILAMYTACRRLEAEGLDGFALLLVSGEETGSWGAKAFTRVGRGAPFLLIGEPTEGKMVSAAKGTLSYDLEFIGEPFHSGYPEFGTSAVSLFNKFCSELEQENFGTDPILGATTWNIGELRSDNPQNVLSARLTCRIYFGTTFVSEAAVKEWMASRADVRATLRGGDTPRHYVALEGFPSAPVAFGSDAPHLEPFPHKMICGPGSIKVAHRDDEFILKSEIQAAVEQYIKIFKSL